MKKLKNKTPVYTIVRLAPRDSSIPPHVKDTFGTLEKAEEMCGVYEQEMLELDVHGFVFKTFPNYYYD